MRSLAEMLVVVEKRIGNTPLAKIDHDQLELYAKLEYTNFMGSVKDRAGFCILKDGIEKGAIDRDTYVIEASSGNFAVSLTAMCHILGLKCVAVIDPGINRVYEKLIRRFAHKVIVVDTLDVNGGYLLTKIEAVKQFLKANPNSYWTNQYENPMNMQAHYQGTAKELCLQLESLDYIFVAVASGGTIAGVSQRVKECFPNVQVVAVDTEGSVIFGRQPKPRLIPGMGSGMRPKLIEEALIDDVVYVSEAETIAACHKLVSQHALFLGGSSGTVFGAIENYFKGKVFSDRPVVAFIAPDRGTGYVDNVYDETWLAAFRSRPS